MTGSISRKGAKGQMTIGELLIPTAYFAPDIRRRAAKSVE
jgi:hypothetical protein